MSVYLLSPRGPPALTSLHCWVCKFMPPCLAFTGCGHRTHALCLDTLCLLISSAEHERAGCGRDLFLSRTLASVMLPCSPLVREWAFPSLRASSHFFRQSECFPETARTHFVFLLSRPLFRPAPSSKVRPRTDYRVLKKVRPVRIAAQRGCL